MTFAIAIARAKPWVSVISPTYNEADNVSQLISEVSDVLADVEHEVIIADDNSPDGTWRRAEEIAKQNSRVTVLRRTGKRGLGFAVIEGFLAARGELVACIDADLQHDPRILPAMAAAIGPEADICVGSRYVTGGRTGEWNWLRRLESFVATRLARLFLGVTLRDPMSGFFMMRRSEFLKIYGQLNGEGFKILLEVIARSKGVRVREMPYTFRDRTAGESKLSRKVVVAYCCQLWRLHRAAALRVEPTRRVSDATE